MMVESGQQQPQLSARALLCIREYQILSWTTTTRHFGHMWGSLWLYNQSNPHLVALNSAFERLKHQQSPADLQDAYAFSLVSPFNVGYIKPKICSLASLHTRGTECSRGSRAIHCATPADLTRRSNGGCIPVTTDILPHFDQVATYI